MDDADFLAGAVGLTHQLCDLGLHPLQPFTRLDARAQKFFQQIGSAVGLGRSPLFVFDVAPAERLRNLSQSLLRRPVFRAVRIEDVTDGSNRNVFQIRQGHAVKDKPRRLHDDSQPIQSLQLTSDGPGQEFEKVLVGLRKD